MYTSSCRGENAIVLISHSKCIPHLAGGGGGGGGNAIVFPPGNNIFVCTSEKAMSMLLKNKKVCFGHETINSKGGMSERERE